MRYDSGSINYSCHTNSRVWISDLDGNGHINCEEEILQVMEAARPLSRFTPSKVPQTFGFAAFDHAAKLHCVNPFGMPHDLPEEVDLPSLPYRDADPFTYNNKEYEDRVTRMHDYHARWYDAALGEACPERLVEGWSVVDPLAERAPAWTPYRYGFNNPILFTDTDGLFESRGDAREYRSNKTDFTRRNSRIRKNKEGTYDIRVKGGDSNSAMRINRNSGGDITHSASARSFTADRISNFFSRISDFFKEGERQQSTAGENWYLYGDGSPSGWEIPAPHANPDGENRSIDISDMVFPGSGNFVEGIENLIESIENTFGKINLGNLSREDSPRNPVDSFCNSCNGPPHWPLPYRRVNESGEPLDTITGYERR